MKLKRRVLIALTSGALLVVTAMPALAAKPLTYTDDKNGVCPRGYTLIDLTDSRYYENADLNDNDLICVK